MLSKIHESAQHHYESLISQVMAMTWILGWALIEIHLNLAKSHEILNVGRETGKTCHCPLVVRWILTPDLKICAALVLLSPCHPALTPVGHCHLCAGPWSQDTQRARPNCPRGRRSLLPLIPRSSASWSLGSSLSSLALSMSVVPPVYSTWATRRDDIGTCRTVWRSHRLGR